MLVMSIVLTDSIHGQFYPKLRNNWAVKFSFPSVYDIDIPEYYSQKIIHLGHFMNPAPYTVLNTMPVAQTFSLFRGLGLRHLVVIEPTGQVVGVITRHDLMEESIERAVDNLHTSSLDHM